MPVPPTAPDVTVVLVHGAFADAASRNGVISPLQRRGRPVVAPPNPLRGVRADSAYLASVLGRIDGPLAAVARPAAGVATPRQRQAAEPAAGVTP